MFNETIQHEPASCETLNLEPSFRHSHNSKEYVRIGVIERDATGESGTVSLQLVQSSTDYKYKVLQACLTSAEIDLLIVGLQDAKERMKAMNNG